MKRRLDEDPPEVDVPLSEVFGLVEDDVYICTCDDKICKCRSAPLLHGEQSLVVFDNELQSIKLISPIIEPIKKVSKFQCRFCSKSYKHQGSLRNHSLQHERTAKFQCDKCTKSFYYPSQLKQHLVCHDVIKQYTCSVCGKKYRRPGSLKFHSKQHEF